MKFIAIFIFLVINIDKIRLESIQKDGKSIVFDSIQTLINGEPAENSFKDLFIDTSKSLFDLIENAHEQITIDEMIRISIQSILILVAERRPDLIPNDFNGNFLNKIYLHVINIIDLL
jgi:hypothetical protein